MEITGSTQDTQRRGPRPHLELKFPRSEEGKLPHGAREPITIVIDDVAWRGTICTTNKNPPYLHHGLESATETSTTTGVLSRARIGDRASLLFEIRRPGDLRLIQILDAGEIRPGTAPARRSAQPRAANPVRVDVPGQAAFPFNDPEAIQWLAHRYWDLISAEQREEEHAFEADLPPARGARVLSKNLFVRLARWKSTRKTADYLSNSEEAVELATRAAFSATSAQEAISAMTQLIGVAQRTATALLHWMAPDLYPILDVRIVAALGEPAPQERNWNDPDYYARIAVRVMELARAVRLDLRTIDRALWTWDKLGGRLR